MMHMPYRLAVLAGVLLFAPCGAQAQAPAPAQAANVTFFVTSAGSDKGADLGGLAGADRLCQMRAETAGLRGKTWRAYLSTQGIGSEAGTNARDRIGKGPWQNVAGVVVAKDVADLHGTNNLTKQTALTETGTVVSGRGDPVNTHDVLTGSQPDGTAFPSGEDRTCGNWTRSGTEGAVMLGHSDRTGLDESVAAKSWNASHPSRGGCSPAALKSTGGAGLFYCFAAD